MCVCLVELFTHTHPFTSPPLYVFAVCVFCRLHVFFSCYSALSCLAASRMRIKFTILFPPYFSYRCCYVILYSLIKSLQYTRKRIIVNRRGLWLGLLRAFIVVPCLRGCSVLQPDCMRIIVVLCRCRCDAALGYIHIR